MHRGIRRARRHRVDPADGTQLDNWIGACRTDDPVRTLTLGAPRVSDRENSSEGQEVTALEGLSCKTAKSVSHSSLESIGGGFVCAGT
jgi:hypothetical protein